MKRYIYLFLLVLFASSCALFDKKDKKTFQGPWADHAESAWNYLKIEAENRGIAVNPPSTLVTEFRTAEGTLGRGEDRFPYFVMNGGKVGGYLRGHCNGFARTVLAREAGGFWNRIIGTHEVAHHTNNHSLCSRQNNGHPNEFRAFAPHWPYWRGRGDVRTFHHTYETEEESICITFVQDPNERSFLSKEELDEIAKELLEMDF